MKKQRKTNLLLTAVILYLLCGILSGCSFPMTVIGTIPPPDGTVKDFFDGLCAGDYAKADACLSSGSVAVKSTPDDIFSQKLLEYLQQSYRYRVVGAVEAEQTSAHAQVELTYLDFNLMADNLKTHSTIIGKKYIHSQHPDYTQVEDGGCTLTEDGARKVAAEALDLIMHEPEKYCATRVFSVELRYKDRAWKIVMDDDLFEAIAGSYAA